MSEDLTQNLPNNDLKLILVRLDSIDTRLDSVDKRLDVMDKRLDSIDARLTTLEDKVERRLLETRPIWESVLEQLKEMSAQLAEVNVRLTKVEQDSRDLRHFFRAGFIDIARVQTDFDERLEKLEGRSK
jgi:chromosome segregation ATPase